MWVVNKIREYFQRLSDSLCYMDPLDDVGPMWLVCCEHGHRQSYMGPRTGFPPNWSPPPCPDCAMMEEIERKVGIEGEGI